MQLKKSISIKLSRATERGSHPVPYPAGLIRIRIVTGDTSK